MTINELFQMEKKQAEDEIVWGSYSTIYFDANHKEEKNNTEEKE